jgi:signal transduction histidine kinase
MGTQHRIQDRDACTAADSPTGLTRLRPTATAVAYLAPPAVTGAVVFFMMRSGAGQYGDPLTGLALAGGALLVGLAAGALTGRAASVAERRAITRNYERQLNDLDHDLRSPMTIIRGEVELVLSQENVSSEERGRSSAAIIEQLEKLELLLRRRYRS